MRLSMNQPNTLTARTRRAPAIASRVANDSRPLLETLEDRLLLTAAVPLAALPPATATVLAPLAVEYQGTIKYGKVAGEARPSPDALTITFTGGTSDGFLTGTVAAEDLGTVQFTGKLLGKRRFTLTIGDDSVNGDSVKGQVTKHGVRLAGTLLDKPVGTKD
ncbi:MAG: hypothetical protein JWO31_1434 [Phycisphaerales bacterium]|nr:hypothetical protein [Phycisphaerales bacterium]